MSGTAFCGVEVPLWDDMVLFVDGNSKITCSNGTYAEPKPNAFSLPHISSCPGSTPECRAACYVHGLQKNAAEIYAHYATNATAVHRLLLAESSLLRSAGIFSYWIQRNCTGGFRWHVSGDVMSLRHARWIVEVCNMASSTPFWIYTRTLQAVPQLCVARNLGVNISADSYNYAKARSVAAVTGARMTYLTRDGSIPEDLPDDAVIFPDYNLRGRGMPDPTAHHWWLGLPQSDRKRVCPTDFFGQSEAHRCGPCDRCLTPSPTQRCTP